METTINASLSSIPKINKTVNYYAFVLLASIAFLSVSSSIAFLYSYKRIMETKHRFNS